LLQRTHPRRRARLLRHGARRTVLQIGGNLSAKSKAPVVSLIVQCIWTCLLCLSGSYGQLLDYIIFAVLIFYILTIFSLFVLRRTRPDAERPYRAIGYPALPALYIVMALFIDVVLLRYKPQYTWPGLFIVLLGYPSISSGLCAPRRRARRKQRDSEPAEYLPIIRRAAVYNRGV